MVRSYRATARVQSQGAELVRCGTNAVGHSAAQNARRKRDREREPPRTVTRPVCAGQPVPTVKAATATHMEQASVQETYLQLWEALCQGHDGSRRKAPQAPSLDTIVSGRPAVRLGLYGQKVLCGRSTDLGWSGCRSHDTYCGYYHRMPIGTRPLLS